LATDSAFLTFFYEASYPQLEDTMPKAQPQYEPFPSWYSDGDFILMLDYGFDESGKGDILIVSAQIGRTDRLSRFSRKWQTVLGKAGIEYFHSKDYGNLDKGIFRGLSAKDRLRLLGRLCGLIHAFVDVGFSAQICISEYKRLTTPEFRSRWGSPYSYAAQVVALSAYSYLKDKGLDREPVNILFEWGHKNVGQAINQFSEVAKSGSTFLRVKTCGGGAKKDNPILQAADMLAYSQWQRFQGQEHDIYNELNAEGVPYVNYGDSGLT
jgi:hypothetical protein